MEPVELTGSAPEAGIEIWYYYKCYDTIERVSPGSGRGCY